MMTFGPWTIHEVYDTRIVDEDGDGIANAYGKPGRSYSKSAKSNAALISAAPDMRSAGKKLLERLATYRTDADWPQAMREAIAEMRAAIAKAEGR